MAVRVRKSPSVIVTPLAERTVLVTSATRAVEPQVVRACRAAGDAVRTLSVDVPEPDSLPADVDVRVGDVCDYHAVRDAVAGMDIVVHPAALLHRFDGAAATTDQYECINLGSAKKVVSAAVPEGARRMVFLSSIAVY